MSDSGYEDSYYSTNELETHLRYFEDFLWNYQIIDKDYIDKFFEYIRIPLSANVDSPELLCQMLTQTVARFSDNDLERRPYFLHLSSHGNNPGAFKIGFINTLIQLEMAIRNLLNRLDDTVQRKNCISLIKELKKIINIYMGVVKRNPRRRTRTTRYVGGDPEYEIMFAPRIY